MRSRERVKKAALFQNPDRIPYDLPEKWGTDFVYTGVDPDPDWKPSLKTECCWEDEWGCIWEKLPGDKTMGQVKFHPLADYANIKDYRFPNYKKPEQYAAARKTVAENREEKFVLAGIPLSFIHRLEYLRGHEAAWTDPYLYPDQLEKLLDRFADIAIETIERLAGIGGVDGIFSCDDWGLQDRLMVTPDMFRKFWKPRYKRVYQYARQKEILTFLHSCGYIADIIDDLIDAGLNVIQMDQQENMGVEKLSKSFGGKICFWCPVDIQNTMVRGTVSEVREYAKKLMDSFGRFNGGFIGKWYPSPAAVNHSPEKIDAMSEVFTVYNNQQILPKLRCEKG